MPSTDPEKKRAQKARWREKNRAQLRAYSLRYNRDWREHNRAHLNAAQRDRRAKDPAKQAARIRKHQRENPGYWAASTRARKAKKRQAVPQWGERRIVLAIYRLARDLGLTVDHIVPLKSPLVCGLHWEGNLQLLPASDNFRKGNRHWPDMW